MEQAIVSAVIHDTSEAKVTVAGVPDQPGIAGRAVPRASPTRDVNVDMIVQNMSERRHDRHLLHRARTTTSTRPIEVRRRSPREIGADGRHRPTPTSPRSAWSAPA